VRIRHDPDGTIWIPEPNAALESALDALYPRIEGRLRWFKGKEESPIKQFVKTIVSGFVNDETYEKRKASCLSCPALIKNKKGMYCGGCRCGTWPLAQLDGTFLPKLRYWSTKCPLQRPGFR